MSHGSTPIRAETRPPYHFDHQSLMCQHIFQQQEVKHGLYVSHVDINVGVCKRIRKVRLFKFCNIEVPCLIA